MHTEKVKTPNGTFTAVFEKSGGWHIAHVKGLRGALTQGKTLSEARENIKEAIDLIIDVKRELDAERKAKTASPERTAAISP